MEPQNQYNPTDKIVTDVPLFIRLLEYAKEDAQTDMDLHQVTENALELLHTGQVLTMRQYDQLVGNTELKENKIMKKQLIAEASRMQKLAGMLNEEQGYEDMDMGFDEEKEIDREELINKLKNLPDAADGGEHSEEELEVKLGEYFVHRYGDCKGEGEYAVWGENQRDDSDPQPYFESDSPEEVADFLLSGGKSLDEMSRTAGTGGAYNITSEGEAVLKQVKATKEIPEGLRPNLVAILIFLYKAKKEGTRAQKKTFADSRGVPQPAVNSLFNMLEEKGLISKKGYVGAEKKDVQNPRPKADISKDIDALELDENEINEAGSQYGANLARANDENVEKIMNGFPASIQSDIKNLSSKIKGEQSLGDMDTRDISTAIGSLIFKLLG